MEEKNEEQAEALDALLEEAMSDQTEEPEAPTVSDEPEVSGAPEGAMFTRDDLQEMLKAAVTAGVTAATATAPQIPQQKASMPLNPDGPTVGLVTLAGKDPSQKPSGLLSSDGHGGALRREDPRMAPLSENQAPKRGDGHGSSNMGWPEGRPNQPKAQPQQAMQPSPHPPFTTQVVLDLVVSPNAQGGYEAIYSPIYWERALTGRLGYQEPRVSVSGISLPQEVSDDVD